MTTPKSKRQRHKPSRLPQFLIIGGVILLAFMLLVFKQVQDPGASPSDNPDGIAEIQLDRALQAGRPTLAFFHSNNCHQCIVMMETVGQVYPEFSSSVALIDVNVYDENNAALLGRVGIQFIPTLIFYDHTGKRQVSVGVMEAEQLRQTLAALAGGE
jgi:thiol:disulfide interchange protein